jgi:hypothetical protein
LGAGTPGRSASRHGGEENEVPEPTHPREYTREHGLERNHDTTIAAFSDDLIESTERGNP